MRVFVDANILFSAVDTRSPTRTLLDAAGRFGAKLVVNDHVLEEANRNILRKRPHLAGGLAILTTRLEKSSVFTVLPDMGLPVQDIPVLSGAVGSSCTHLWTGDKKHFGKWYGKNIHGVSIVSSRMLVDYLITSGWTV